MTNPITESRNAPETSLSVPSESMCELAVEMVQDLARTLLKGEGEPSQRVETTYEQVTQLLLKAFPTHRPNDITFLSSLIKTLFDLSAEHADSYATDLLCSDIAEVKFQNRHLGTKMDFVHNLLISIRRIGLLANSSCDEGSDRDREANEKFLVNQPSALIELLSDSAVEFFHKR